MADRDAKMADDDILREAMELFEESEEASEENRTQYYNDTRFAKKGDQWPEALRRQRIQEARPALVINKLPPLIRSVVNESRQNRPSIKVSPVDNEADPDTAEVIGGLTRSIERVSNASVAYNTAVDHAVTGGFGFFRIAIDYAHQETFDLEARIERIPNPLMVHWDTDSTEFDASDWNYAFISEMMSRKKYEKKYPDASMVPFEGDTRDDSIHQWVNEDTIRLAEYFKREEEMEKLILFSMIDDRTGQEVFEAIQEQHLLPMAQAFFGEQASSFDEGDIVQAFIQTNNMVQHRERDVTRHRVIHRLINGMEVLEEDPWPGESIPIVPVWGNEVFIDGHREFSGMVRDAKDPQAMHNFWRSSMTELVALAPRAPWVGPKGFVPKGDEDRWQSANTRNHAYLEYDIEAGAAPSREPFAGIPAGALQEATLANEDLHDITGVYPSAIGDRSNETSGKAILARERQGDVSNFHFIDNLARAIRYAGQVLVEIIPHVYSTRQTIRILGEDQKEKIIRLTQDNDRAAAESGENERMYNLSVGKYDVDVTQGPSFQTQREETRETLIEILRNIPDAAPYVGDELLRHMDFVGAEKIARRLQAMLPPAVQEAEQAAEDGQNPEVAALRAQLQQATQALQQLEGEAGGQIEELTKNLDTLQNDKTLEHQVKMREADIREMEANKPEPDPAMKYAHDEAMARMKFDHEAQEKARDRHLQLTQTILNHNEGVIKEDDVDSAWNRGNELLEGQQDA